MLASTLQLCRSALSHVYHLVLSNSSEERVNNLNNLNLWSDRPPSYHSAPVQPHHKRLCCKDASQQTEGLLRDCLPGCWL